MSQNQIQFNQMTLAMDELVKYFSDLGDMNEIEHSKLTAAINT